MPLPGQKESNILKRLKNKCIFFLDNFLPSWYSVADWENYGEFWNWLHFRDIVLKRNTEITRNALYDSSGNCTLFGGPGLSNSKRLDVKCKGFLPLDTIMHILWGFFLTEDKQSSLCIHVLKKAWLLIIQFPVLQISNFVLYAWFFSILNISIPKRARLWPG